MYILWENIFYRVIESNKSSLDELESRNSSEELRTYQYIFKDKTGTFY